MDSPCGPPNHADRQTYLAVSEGIHRVVPPDHADRQTYLRVSEGIDRVVPPTTPIDKRIWRYREGIHRVAPLTMPTDKHIWRYRKGFTVWSCQPRRPTNVVGGIGRNSLRGPPNHADRQMYLSVSEGIHRVVPQPRRPTNVFGGIDGFTMWSPRTRRPTNVLGGTVFFVFSFVVR